MRAGKEKQASEEMMEDCCGKAQKEKQGLEDKIDDFTVVSRKGKKAPTKDQQGDLHANKNDQVVEEKLKESSRKA